MLRHINSLYMTSLILLLFFQLFWSLGANNVIFTAQHFDVLPKQDVIYTLHNVPKQTEMLLCDVITNLRIRLDMLHES